MANSRWGPAAFLQKSTKDKGKGSQAPDPRQRAKSSVGDSPTVVPHTVKGTKQTKTQKKRNINNNNKKDKVVRVETGYPNYPIMGSL